MELLNNIDFGDVDDDFILEIMVEKDGFYFWMKLSLWKGLFYHDEREIVMVTVENWLIACVARS